MNLLKSFKISLKTGKMGKTLLEHIENRKAELFEKERWFRQRGYERSAGLVLHVLQELNDLTDTYFNVNTNDTEAWQPTTYLGWKKKSDSHGRISHVFYNKSGLVKQGEKSGKMYQQKEKYGSKSR